MPVASLHGRSCSSLAEPARALENPVFWLEDGSLLAGATALTLAHAWPLRTNADHWEGSRGRQRTIRLVTLGSLVLWTGVVLAGRWDRLHRGGVKITAAAGHPVGRLDSRPHTLCQDTDIATAVRENGLIFPWVEATHVLALTAVVGSAAILDLRLLGWASRDRPVGKVLADVLPCVWTGFALAIVSGALLFSSNARVYAHNPFFVSKLVFLGLIGVNTVVFHGGVGRKQREWETAGRPPAPARVAGAISMILSCGCAQYTVCVTLGGLYPHFVPAD